MRMPQFQALRSVIRQNPAMLQPLLQQMGQSNPQLLSVGTGHILCGWKFLVQEFRGTDEIIIESLKITSYGICEILLLLILYLMYSHCTMGS